MQSYATSHFLFMADVSRELAAIRAEVQDHSYAASVFGSWWFTIRVHGARYRVVYDAREGVLSVESSPTENRPEVTVSASSPLAEERAASPPGTAAVLSLLRTAGITA